MSKIKVVVWRNIKDIHQKTTLIIIACAFVVVVAGAALILNVEINKVLGAGLEREATVHTLEHVIGLSVYFMSLLMTLSYLLTFDPITKEKSKRTIESLLATPLTVHDVWLGKSLALFLPGLIAGVASTSIILLIANFAIIPANYPFILPVPLAVLAFLLNPLIALLLSLLISFMSLAYNVYIATVALILLIAGLGFGQVTLGPASWDFVLISAGLIAFLGLITFFLSRVLSKERIVLSGRG